MGQVAKPCTKNGRANVAGVSRKTQSILASIFSCVLACVSLHLGDHAIAPRVSEQRLYLTEQTREKSQDLRPTVCATCRDLQPKCRERAQRAVRYLDSALLLFR